MGVPNRRPRNHFDPHGGFHFHREYYHVPRPPPPPPPWWSPITSVFVVAGARSYNSIQSASSGIKARLGSRPFKTIQSASSGIRASFDKFRRQRKTKQQVRNDGYETTVNEELSINEDDKEQEPIDSENDSTLEWPTEWDDLIDAQSPEADINEAELFLDEQTDYLTSLDPIIKDEVVHWIGLCRQDIYIYRFGEDHEEILFDHYRQVVESVSVLKFLSAPDMDTAKAHITAQELLKSKCHAVKESDKHMLIACVTYLLLSSQNGEPNDQHEALQKVSSLLESFPEAHALFLKAGAKKRLLPLIGYNNDDLADPEVKKAAATVYTYLVKAEEDQDEVDVHDEEYHQEEPEGKQDLRKDADTIEYRKGENLNPLKESGDVKESEETGPTVTKSEHPHKPLRNIFLDSFTPYNITSVLLIIGLGTWKACAVQYSAPIVGNVLDWVIGIVITIIMSWIKGLESHRGCRWMFTSVFDRRRKRRQATDP